MLWGIGRGGVVIVFLAEAEASALQASSLCEENEETQYSLGLDLVDWS